MYKKIIKSATCLSTNNKVKFNLTIGKYQNIMSFLIDNNILFLSEINLNLPTELRGNGNSHNLLEFLANNSNDNNILMIFIKYFMNLIDLRYDNDYKVNYYIVNNNKWQDMNIIIGLRVPIAPTTTTTTTPFTSSIQYGRLYNWYAATDSRNIAPVGWHVSTYAEWTTLTTYLGGTNIAGGKLKEAGTAHWDVSNDGATNETSFTALPGGIRYLNSNGTFGNIVRTGKWWCADVYTGYAICKSIISGANNVYSNGYDLSGGLSVRCVRDIGNTETTVTDIDGNNYTSVTIGTQTWLVQNLATTHYRNGNIILQDFSGTVGAYANYNNDESYVFY